MKTSFQALFTVVFVLLFGTVAFCQTQHEMYLPAPTQATYLNEIIMGDTTTSGARKDTDRVYVLQRGGVWFFNGTVDNVGWTVRIEGADTGSGPLAAIYGTVASGGTSVPSAFINAQGSVSLKNVMIDGYYDLDSSAYSNYGFPTQIVVFNAAGYRLDVDSCVIVNSGQAHFQTFAACTVIDLEDNIFANYGAPPNSNTGNGRVIDLRNVSCDSLIMINNTMVNGTDRVVRHIASTGRLNNFIFEHNTVYENMGRYGTIALGLVGNRVQIMDNLFVDPMSFGADTSYKRQYDFREMDEFDSNGKVIMTWIYNQKVDTLAGSVNTDWMVKDNYWRVTPAVLAAYDTINANGWDPGIWPGRPLSDYIKSQLSDTSDAMIQENDLAFANVPGTGAGMTIWYAKPTSLGGSAQASSGGNFVNYDQRVGLYYQDTLNCSYPTTLAAYTGTTDGFPAGDLDWFPGEKQQWLTTTPVKSIGNNIPAEFSLEQNYPNPFNPSTNIKFSLKQAGMMSLAIYNVLGQVVQVVDQGYKPAGVYAYNINMDRYASGVYFYTLRQGPNFITKKMLLLK